MPIIKNENKAKIEAGYYFIKNHFIVVKITIYLFIFCFCFWILSTNNIRPMDKDQSGFFFAEYMVLCLNKDDGQLELINLFSYYDNPREYFKEISNFDELISDILLERYSFYFTIRHQDELVHAKMIDIGFAKIKLQTEEDHIAYEVEYATGDSLIRFYYYKVANGIPFDLRVGYITRMDVFASLFVSFLVVAVIFIVSKVVFISSISIRRWINSRTGH